MIAIAGVIGAGLFVGSGAAIQQAGPGILVAYAAAGVVVILVMRMLGEMAAASPETGSFSAYADRALGRWAGFSIGWLYAWFWIIVLGVEATAGAAIVHRWVPGIDQWVWALLLMVLLTLTNIASVKSFGEFEFWFASIKIAAIVVFLTLGIVAILGFLPGVKAPVAGSFPMDPERCSAVCSWWSSHSSEPRSPRSRRGSRKTRWTRCGRPFAPLSGAS